MTKAKVLFVGLRNSARSQMAEGFLRYLAGDLFEVFSAGIEADEVNPFAIQVMEESEIDISRHYFKNVEEYLTFNFAFVITVCEVAHERCPIFHSAKSFRYWGFSDPAAVGGSVQKQLETFRRVRDEVKNKVWEFVSETSLFAQDKAAVKE